MVMLRSFFKQILMAVSKIICCVLCIFPIRKTKIVFYIHGKRGFCGNSKYIIQKLNERKSPYTVVYATKYPHSVSKKIAEDGNFSCVRYPSLRWLYEIQTCGILITDDGVPEAALKRKGQIYVSSWHGGGTFKKVGLGTAKTRRVQKFLNAFYRNLDYMTVSCIQNVKDYSKSFLLPEKNIIPLGMPRADLLFDMNKTGNAVRNVRQKYSVPEKTKIVLIAPTFRKDESSVWNSLLLSEVLCSFKELFGSDVCFLYRSHYFEKSGHIFDLNINIIDASSYDDVQELVCASSALLTDYSSIMYDFALMKKAVFLFQSDLEQYVKNNRSFFMPPQDWPFLRSENTAELRNSIVNFNEHSYEQKIESYLKKIGSKDDGTSSARFCDFIDELIRAEGTYPERSASGFVH